MVGKKHTLFLFLILFSTLYISAQHNVIKTDSLNSYVNFSIEAQNIYGTIAGIDTFIHLDKEDLNNSVIKGSATVRTINTGNIIRDKKLLSKKMLNEREFPLISFKSTYIEKMDENVYMVTGDLTIKDITEKIYIEFYFQLDRVLAVSHFNTEDYDLSIKGKESNKVDLYFELFHPGAE